MCAACVSSLRIFQHLWYMGVNYFSSTFRREPSFTWEVQLGMVCSSGADTVYAYLYFWYQSVDIFFEVLRPGSTKRLGDICTWEKPNWLTLFDEGDCNNGISSESYMMGIHWPFCTRPPRFVNIICTYVNCASLGAPALDDDIALPPSICALRLGLRFRVRPGKEVRWKHTLFFFTVKNTFR